MNELRALIRRDPDEPRARYELGVLYSSVGLDHEAIEQLEAAVRLTPENPNIRSKIATVYDALTVAGDEGADLKAQEHLTKGLRLDPEHLDALLLATRRALRAKSGEAAMHWCNRAAAIDPESLRETLASFFQANLVAMLSLPVFRNGAERKRRRDDYEMKQAHVQLTIWGAIVAVGFLMAVWAGLVHIQLTPNIYHVIGLTLAGLLSLAEVKREAKKAKDYAESAVELTPLEEAVVTATLEPPQLLLSVVAEVLGVSSQRLELLPNGMLPGMTGPKLVDPVPTRKKSKWKWG